MFLEGLVVAYVLAALAINTFFVDVLVWCAGTRLYRASRTVLRTLGLLGFVYVVALALYADYGHIPVTACVDELWDWHCLLNRDLTRAKMSVNVAWQWWSTQAEPWLNKLFV